MSLLHYKNNKLPLIFVGIFCSKLRISTYLAWESLSKSRKSIISLKTQLNTSNIYRHIVKQHGTNRPVACTECPNSYTHIIHLERHFSSAHEKEGKKNGIFPCEECSKVFTYLYQLNWHKICEHAEKKPFQCDLCDQSYTSKEGVKRHKLTVHEGNCC